MNRHEIEANVPSSTQSLTRLSAEQSADYREETLNSAGVPAARVRTLSESLPSDQVIGQYVIKAAEHHTGS